MRGIAAFLTLAVLAACDPSGPGSIVGNVTGTALAGVVLEVEGVGIQGFGARGDTRAYSAAVPSRTNVHRLVLVSPTAGELEFEILVDDLAMESPVITVIEATDGGNALVPPSTATVSIER